MQIRVLLRKPSNTPQGRKGGGRPNPFIEKPVYPKIRKETTNNLRFSQFSDDEEEEGEEEEDNHTNSSITDDEPPVFGKQDRYNNFFPELNNRNDMLDPLNSS